MLEKRKGVPGMIHRVSILSTQKSALPGTAALSQTQTGPESSSKSLARASQALASEEEESPEARRFGYGHIDTGSRWLPIKMVQAGFLGASGGVGTARSMT